jgi:pyruvate dehydrogenase E2 component (dihydrolipoamide acetyltransferase)
MPIEILMPALSPTMTEGNLAKWLKKEGDKIKPGDVLAEIETDKATMEVDGAAGTQNVPVNNLIALLLEDGETVDSIKDYKPKTIVKQAPTSAPATVASSTIVAPTPMKTSDARIKASPLAKRIAEIEKIDLSRIQGSGPQGRIVKEDVLNSKSKRKSTGNFVDRNSQEFTTIPNSNVRRVIAKRLVESKQTIPHFYLSIECNVDKLLCLREDLNLTTSQEKPEFKVSINDCIIKAVALALAEVPEANASWSEDAIIQYNNVDISVAVAIDGGLITPIIQNADQKSVIDISNEMKSLAKRAKENALRPEEFQGGGFSISNLGMYGIKQFQAIVNPPQSCIMAIGASNKRPVVINDNITMATIMDVSISCDHRVVDGAVGAKFLAAFKKFIEQPLRLFI